MKIRILNLFVILTLALFMSCNEDDNDMSGLNIRISNISQFDFENVEIDASSENVTVNIIIENLNSGQISEYMRYDKARSFPNAELQIEGETFILIPLTTGFDVSLEDGNWTYEINANDSQDQNSKLNFSLIKD